MFMFVLLLFSSQIYSAAGSPNVVIPINYPTFSDQGIKEKILGYQNLTNFIKCFPNPPSSPGDQKVFYTIVSPALTSIYNDATQRGRELWDPKVSDFKCAAKNSIAKVEVLRELSIAINNGQTFNAYMKELQED